jgi:hypothetical protein
MFTTKTYRLINMKFIKQPDDFVFAGCEDIKPDSEFLQSLAPQLGPVDRLTTDIHISDDGQLWLAKYRVVFGYRLRGGFMEDAHEGSEFDICCGADEVAYVGLLRMVISIIERNVEAGKDPFDGIPQYSRIKPYFNDLNFIRHMATLAYGEKTA